MKHILLFVATSLLITSCSKTHELSQEEHERSEPLKENQIIENEEGGLNFFVYTNGAAISVNVYRGSTEVPVVERIPYNQYSVVVSDLQENTEYIIELQYHSVATPGTFDLMFEGFTALPTTKNFWVKGIPISVSDAGTTKKFFKMQRGVVRYTFIPY